MYEELKKRRLELEKTLEEIAEETKIKKYYLYLIEEGKFDELPIELYTRSYIKTYAASLGLEPSMILKDYDEYLKTKKQTTSKVETEPVKKTSDKKFSFFRLSNSITSVGIIFAVIVIIILFIRFEKKEHTIPPPPKVKQEIVSEATQIEEKIEKNEPKQEIYKNQQKLKIEATDKVWMRITIDDREKREFLLNPGQTIELQSNKNFKLHIGNAGGVKVLFNDRDLGQLGQIGQVVYLNLPQEKD